MTEEEKPTEPKPNDTTTETSDNTSTSSSSPGKPYPIQIVSIGTSEDAYAFTFHEEGLNTVLSQIPVGWKVSIVSVVGAFRTGKSFLLSWLIQYLHCENKDEEEWYKSIDSVGEESGFHWRGGAERDTTGIWIWSEPFFLKRDDEEIAVILMDTQGMFDHETTMGLTASIFGLSTLLSSYQIYNVDKKIQEDHLQQLALFSEYGHMALREEEKEKPQENKEDKPKEGEEEMKPFQHIEFLIRDWQNFDCDGEGEIDDLLFQMQYYLDQVIAEREAKDLQDTREQIHACFDSISCFMLTHPGFEVTKKKYHGQVDRVDPIFLRLLSVYCRRVFEQVQPKQIHGREVLAAEFYAYTKAYANLFSTGAHFPEASTMLDATAHANNVNATTRSLNLYREGMDAIAGVNCTQFIKMSELETSHRRLMIEAMDIFDDIANFGNKKDIQEARSAVTKQIWDNFEMYTKLNEGRNPFAGFETILVPMVIALISFILRKAADTTCSSWSQTCKASSDVLAEVSSIVFIFMIIVASTKYKQISEMLGKVQSIFAALSGNAAAAPVPAQAKGD